MKTINELSDLTDRWAIITGSAGHIGRTFSETLAEMGSNLILVDRDLPALEKLSKKLMKYPNIETKIFHCDLEIETERESLIAYINCMERVDILINNAAFGGTAKLEGWSVELNEQSLVTWRRALEVNLTAIFHITKSISGKLSEHNKGSIINVASIYGFLGPDFSLYDDIEMGNPFAYGASKAGLINLTKYLATSYAPKIRVNCISPGGIKRGQPSVFMNKYIKKTPMQRMGNEQDFKGVVGFLASDLSSYITGQNIVVDGGFSIW